MKPTITHAELLAYCKYNPKTGIFTAKRNGARLGHYDKNNEKRTMHIERKKYQEARLAVFYMTGKWPVSYVKNTSKTAQYNTKLRYLVYKDGSEFISGTQLKCEHRQEKEVNLITRIWRKLWLK
jgi:hypothetical protein